MEPMTSSNSPDRALPFLWGVICKHFEEEPAARGVLDRVHVALSMRVGRGTLQRIQEGVTNPTVATLVELAQAMGLSLAQLVKAGGEPESEARAAYETAGVPGDGVPSVRPIRNSRQARLQMLVDEAGSAVAVERLTGTPRSHISAMLAGSKGLGDDLATRLEVAFGRPFGWMDMGVDPKHTVEFVTVSGALGAIGNAASLLPFVERRELGELLSLYVMAPDSVEMKRHCLDWIERKR